MNFSEKGGEVRATLKNRCKQSPIHVLPVAEEAREKSEEVGISPSLFPASSDYFRKSLRKMFWQNRLVSCGLGERAELLPLFPAALRVHRLACPVATGKNAGDDAA